MKGRKQKSAQHDGRRREKWQKEVLDDVGGREEEGKEVKHAPRKAIT